MMINFAATLTLFNVNIQNLSNEYKKLDKVFRSVSNHLLLTSVALRNISKLFLLSYLLLQFYLSIPEN